MKIKSKVLCFLFSLTIIFGCFTNVKAIENKNVTLNAKETTIEFIKSLANGNVEKLKEVADEDIYNWFLSNKDSVKLSEEEKSYINRLSPNDNMEVKIGDEKIVVDFEICGTPMEAWLDKKNIKVINYFENPIKFINIPENEKTTVQKYLEQNNVIMDTDSKNNDENLLKIFNGDLEKNQIFLTGEHHATVRNNDLEISFLRFLNRYAGVKYLLNELGYAQGQLINRFLETGDTKILDNMFNKFKGTFAYNNESYERWIKLYEYNKKLDKDKKIKVIGIDIEHQQGTAYEYLITILPKSEAPKSIKANIDLLKAKKFKGLEDKLKKDIQTYNKEYKKYLGDKFLDFSFVVDNIANSTKCYKSDQNQFGTLREACINENFKKIYSHLPKGKYYGEFGMAHVYQGTNGDPNVDENVFAKFLAKDFEPTKGKVISIQYVYKNSYMRMQNGEPSKMDEGEFEDVSNMMNSIIKSETAIFKLNSEGSPFSKDPYMIPSPKVGVTTDYLQYVVLVKNSKAASTYNKSKN